MTLFSSLKSLSWLGTAKSRGHDQPLKSDQAGDGPNSNLQSHLTILPPLIPRNLPYVLPLHQPSLAFQGWTTITYPTPTDPLFEASESLFRASKAFFDLPASDKEGFRTDIGTEEGWSRVEGEKEFITLRSIDKTPNELKDAATAYWKEAGVLLNEILGTVAESLGLGADALTRFSEPCKEFGGARTATMLRLFRYEGFEGTESKIVAESHKDLGLLSFVIGDTPGLEVWDRNVRRWFQIERNYDRPAGSLLVGRQLERLSNGRYTAGGHLVRSYPNFPTHKPKAPSEKNYRYSIVFVLRAHSPVVVNTDNLTTPITGKFEAPLINVEAREVFENIKRSHFNINTEKEEREQQRLKILARKQASSAPMAPNTENEDSATRKSEPKSS